MSLRGEIFRRPIVLLLAVTLVIGLFVFRDYGLTWDEPLFYKYADALGYAYTPSNWLGGQFDLNKSYGPSGDDHKNRGPGYLLVAREPVYLVEKLGLDASSAWHLVNFGTFLLGVYFVYRIAERLMHTWAALAASSLFAFQPLLWGHAFINPKDMPFLVFLTGSIWLGFRMVDQLVDEPSESIRRRAGRIVAPALFLGLATANRVLGPLAALLVLAYLLERRPRIGMLLWMVPYGVLAAFVVLMAWPYLWEGPARFLTAFQFMSANPTILPVLFADQVYRAYDLPRRYLPFYLFFTLTEFIWPLFFLGIAAGLGKFRADWRRLTQAGLILSWFLIPVMYVLLRRPPMYDGMRHFLFILPPVFIIAGFSVDFLLVHVHRRAVFVAATIVCLLPGFTGIVRLHPYEYTYYNSFIGGTSGAFRHYETDYWLTCYKDALQSFNEREHQPVRLYVHREAEVAQPYAAPNVTVLDERGAKSQIGPGDFVLVNTRTNEDRQTFHDAPDLVSIGRGAATFCVIKSIP
jgi:dolichyl-phosphate-mannose-protein mannosyltransferase